ncbi:hypothetical protein CFOL_v3_36433, partial [Cephalotus follicularis]
IPMDDYDLVLGMEFMDQVKAIPIPHANSLCILEEGKTCMVPCTRSNKGTKTLSAMQLDEGFKQDEGSYLTALMGNSSEAEPKPKDLPTQVEEVFEDFQDILPTEFPKELPPKREVDHHIELEPGAKPTSQAPNRMAPPELEELRRERKELLDAGSNAPYGAPVPFQRNRDSSLRLCSNYRSLNKVTVKNEYPIPLIVEHFDQLGNTWRISKHDLYSGDYKVQIVEGDKPKTTCATRHCKRAKHSRSTRSIYGNPRSTLQDSAKGKRRGRRSNRWGRMSRPKIFPTAFGVP